jgi:hypothetical protein
MKLILLLTPFAGKQQTVHQDQKIEVRTVSTVFKEEGSEDRQAQKSWHLCHARGGGEARARGSIFQTTLKTQFRVQALACLWRRQPKG